MDCGYYYFENSEFSLGFAVQRVTVIDERVLRKYQQLESRYKHGDYSKVDPTDGLLPMRIPTDPSHKSDGDLWASKMMHIAPPIQPVNNNVDDDEPIVQAAAPLLQEMELVKEPIQEPIKEAIQASVLDPVVEEPKPEPKPEPEPEPEPKREPEPEPEPVLAPIAEAPKRTKKRKKRVPLPPPADHQLEEPKLAPIVLPPPAPIQPKSLVPAVQPSAPQPAATVPNVIHYSQKQLSFMLRHHAKLLGVSAGALLGASLGSIPAALIFAGIILLPVTFGGSSAIIGVGVALIAASTILGGTLGAGIGFKKDKQAHLKRLTRLASTHARLSAQLLNSPAPQLPTLQPKAKSTSRPTLLFWKPQQTAKCPAPKKSPRPRV